MGVEILRWRCLEEGKILWISLLLSYFFPTELRKFQLLGSLPNLKRIKLEKVSIPSFWGPCLVEEFKENILAFRSCTIQVSDALPNLMEINIDYCNDLVEFPTSLCGVILLKNSASSIVINCLYCPNELEGR